MIQKVLLIAVAYLATSALAAPSLSEAGSCPGGHQEGDQVDMGQYFYECRGGQLVPKGCLTPRGRIQLGQTFDFSSQVRSQCVIDSSGFPTMEHKSCLDSSSREHAANERWNDGTVIYECKRDGKFLSVDSVGCQTSSGPLDIGGKANIGELVHICTRSRTYLPTFKPWGCFGKDGQQHATGDEYNAGDIWYYCMEKNGVITNDAIGCVHNGKRYRDGERYTENDILFTCFIKDNVASFHVSGCVTKTGGSVSPERRVGCSWVEGTEPFQVQFHCVPDDVRKTAVKTAEKCLYVLDRGTISLEIGCYRVIEKVGVACVKNSNNPSDVSLTSFPVDQNGNIQSPPAGTRNC